MINRKKRLSSSEIGASTIDILLGLAIVAGFIVWIFSVANKGRTKFSLIEFNQDIARLSSDIQDAYKLHSSYGSGNMDSIVIAQKMLSDKYIDGDDLINPWRGQITVDGNDDTFSINTDKVPNDICNSLVITKASEDIKSIAINGSTKTLENGAINPTDAASGCVNSNSNSITWEFY